MEQDNLALAQAVCSRLCHDLGGPAGALAGALDLLDGAGEDALDVASDAARIIDRRLRFYRAAVGGTCDECGAEDLAQLTEGLTLGRRVTVDLDGLAEGCQIPPAVAQTLLLALWVATDALPRGGAVRVAGSPEAGISIWPDGPAAAWPTPLIAGLTGEEVPPAPRAIAVPLMLAAAAAGRLRCDLLLGMGPGAAPLLLTRRAEH